MKTTSSWHGQLDLVYTHHQGETKITHTLATSPLKIQRPFYPEGKQICHSVILHTAGGIVGGDRLSQNIHLQANAQALITTAAAAKIYRSNGQEAQQNINIKLDSGAYLEWLPQENIIFNGANYRQKLQIELEPEATYLGWEINRLGRTARGETFNQGQWRNYTEIWQQGKPLWIDRQWLPGSEEILNSPHGLAGKAIVATLVGIGKPVAPEIIDKARHLWNTNQYQGEAGVTQTQGQGLLCRYRGTSTTEVRTWFTQIWHLLRLFFQQYQPLKPRIWI